jgi:cyclic pyranopterin phosphate synthase
MKKIIHLNDEGQAHMVDISKKRSTSRKSTASGFVKLKKETIKTIRSN